MSKKSRALPKPQAQMVRYPGLDLIRCIALLFVLVFHSYLNNGYYHEPQTGFSMWLAGSFRWLSVACIGLFLMLTGYLKSENTSIKSCYKALLTVGVGYFLAAAVSIPVRHFFLGTEQTFEKWIESLFKFNAVYYGWYVEMYLGLVLLIPFINMALKQMTEKKHLLCFAGAMLVLTSLSGATKMVIFPDYWRITYPVTYYVLGAVVRRLQPKFNPFLGILGALSAAGVLGAFTVLSTDGKLDKALTWEFADIWIVIIAFLLFVSLYRVDMRKVPAKILAVMSGGCFGGYMLSHLFDAWVYKLYPEYKTPEKYILLFLVATLPIYFASVISGIGLQALVGVILPKKKKQAEKRSFENSQKNKKLAKK